MFIQNKWFWLAMAVAPCVWAAMYWLFAMPFTFAQALSWRQVLSVILVYPILEEIVFRGALQGWLLGFASLCKGAGYLSVANLITSLLFMALHFINHSPFWAVLVFFPSLVFGWSRERFDSILPAIVLHVFYNAGFLLLFG